ncbi:Inner centromere protein-related protein pic1 [Schizosaccharomyces pombe]
MGSNGSELWFNKELEYSQQLTNGKMKEFFFLVSETMDWLNEHMLEVSKLQLESDIYELVRTPTKIKEKYSTPRLSPVHRCALPTPRMRLTSIQHQLEEAAVEGYKSGESNTVKEPKELHTATNTETQFDDDRDSTKLSSEYVKDDIVNKSTKGGVSPIKETRLPTNLPAFSPTSVERRFTEWNVPLRETSPSPSETADSPNKLPKQKHPAYSFVTLPKREEILKRPASLHSRVESTNSFINQLNRRRTKDNLTNNPEISLDEPIKALPSTTSDAPSSLLNTNVSSSPSKFRKFLSSVIPAKTDLSAKESLTSSTRLSTSYKTRKRSSGVAFSSETVTSSSKERKRSVENEMLKPHPTIFESPPEITSFDKSNAVEAEALTAKLKSNEERLPVSSQPGSDAKSQEFDFFEAKIPDSIAKLNELTASNENHYELKTYDRAERLRQKIQEVSSNKRLIPSTPPTKKPINAVLDAAKNSAAKDLHLAKMKLNNKNDESSLSPAKSHAVITQAPKIPLISTFTRLSTRKSSNDFNSSNSRPSSNALKSDANENTDSSLPPSKKEFIEKSLHKLSEPLHDDSRQNSDHNFAPHSRPIAIRVATASQRELEQTEKRKAKNGAANASNIESRSSENETHRFKKIYGKERELSNNEFPSRQTKTVTSANSSNIRDMEHTISDKPRSEPDAIPSSKSMHSNKPFEEKSEKPTTKRLVTNSSNVNASWHSNMLKRQEDLRKKKPLTDNGATSRHMLKSGLTRVTSKPTQRFANELAEDMSLAFHSTIPKKMEPDSVTSVTQPSVGSLRNNFDIGTTNSQNEDRKKKIAAQKNKNPVHGNVGLTNQHGFKTMHHNVNPFTKQNGIMKGKLPSSSTSQSNKPSMHAPAKGRNSSMQEPSSKSPLLKTPKSNYFPGYGSLSPNTSVELPEINSDYSDDSDDEGNKKKVNLPSWAESPELREQLKRQQKWDPDKIFGMIKPLQMDEYFRSKDRSKIRFRPRSSSADWSSQDRLTQAEIDNYKKNMGFL